MFVALVTTASTNYKGFDRVCDLYINTSISVFGKVDTETEAAWLDYIDLLDTEPISCNEKSLSIMKRVITLCDKNKEDLEIVLFSKDMHEPCAYSAEFIGFDVAGVYFSSILATESWYNMPVQYAHQLNKYGLFNTIEQANDLAKYVNSLTESEIEPEAPYLPVKVYVLDK